MNHTQKKESLIAQSAHVTDEVQVAQQAQHETDEVQVAQQTKVRQSTARSAQIMNKINCMYTNADSLMNKLSELKAQVTQSQPMIIGITEVKPKKCRFNIVPCELQLEGYELFSNLEKDGRGICLYIHRTLKPTECTINDTATFEECVWAEVRLAGKDKILIGCIYRSPNSSDTNNEKLCQLIGKINEANASHILMMADFNYPHIDWVDDSKICEKASRTENQFLESIRDAFLTQHIMEPTRYRVNQVPHLLDLIFTNEDEMVNNYNVKDPLGKSDHCLITFTYQCQTPVTGQSGKSFLYEKGNYKKLRGMLQDDWETKFVNLDAEESWELFISRLKQAEHECIPKKKSGQTRKYKPVWMNAKTLDKVRKKHRAWKKYLRTKEWKDYLDYTKARNQARKATRQAVKTLEQSIAKDIKSNPKHFWSYARSKMKTRPRIGDLQTEENAELTTTDKEKAEVLCKFFSDVFTREDLINVPTFEEHQGIDNLDDINFTADDVEKKLENLKIGKSPGPDGIHPRVLKELAKELKMPLFIIFRKSLDTGILPKVWKIANVSPIFKKGSRHLAANYRPVSLTAVACKVMESLVKDAIVTHMEKNKLIADQQHGFIPGRSCTTQLISTLEDWTKILDDGECVDAIYMDLKKAFDSVPHQRLLAKLKGYGIKGKLLKWIETFLTCRKHCVLVNGAASSWTEVVSGVPQGSVLGPILFILYINDLTNVVTCDMKIFADDTKIYHKTSTRQDCINLQKDIDRLQDWAEKWQLKFHPDKCKVLRIGHGHPEFTYTGTAGSVKNK